MEIGVPMLLVALCGAINGGVFVGDEAKSARKSQIVITEDHPYPSWQRVASGSGMQVEALTFQLRKFFNIQDDSGVLVRYVRERSAASRAGLRAGDIIVAIGSRTIRSPSQFVQELRSAAGSSVQIKIVRAKQIRLVNLDVAS